jgi:hypothetical protein
MTQVNRLEDLQVLTSGGEPVPLGNFWRGRSVVLVLVRHFG